MSDEKPLSLDDLVAKQSAYEARVAACTHDFSKESIFGGKLCAHCDVAELPWTRGALTAAQARIRELEAERLAALRNAYALTLDTQTIGEAVTALVGLVRAARDKRDAAEAKVRALESACERGRAKIQAVDADKADHQAWAAERVGALEEALRPFAKFAESFPPVMEGATRDTDDRGVALCAARMMHDYTITFGDFRRARAALAGAASGLVETVWCEACDAPHVVTPCL